MNVDDVLDADWEAVGTLRNPVLVVALRGWFDVCGVATGALEWAIQDRAVTVVASVDPDPFFDFTQERPETFIDEDGETFPLKNKFVKFSKNNKYITF